MVEKSHQPVSAARSQDDAAAIIGPSCPPFTGTVPPIKEWLKKGFHMTIGYVLGAGISDDPNTGLDLYERYDVVRTFYQKVHEWTGFSPEQLLAEKLPETPQGLRWSVGEVRQAANMFAIHDVLAESGIRPTAVGGLSLGGLASGCLAGSLSRRELLVMRARMQVIPALPPEAPKQGMAVWLVPADLDPESSLAGRAGIYTAVNYGPTRDGKSQMRVLAGYRQALDSLAADLPPGQIWLIPDRPFAAHCPLRAPAQEFLAPYIAAVNFTDPQLPVCSGLAPRTLTSADDIRELYIRNTVETVSFVHVYTEMARNGVDFALALGQCPPGGFLDEPFPMVNVKNFEDIEQAKSAIYELGVDFAGRKS